MKFKIIHETAYEFSEPVFLEPHSFIFKPKNRPYVLLESHTLKLSLQPAGIAEQLDAEDNHIYFCWFNGMHKKINLVSELVIDCKEHNPYNILIHPEEFNTLPFTYAGNQFVLLKNHLAAEVIDEGLLNYGKKILADCNYNSLQFLTALTIAIHNDFVVSYREIGIPFNPDKTFHLKNGSCRDLVWMQIHLLRTLGIAARFVSGYYYIAIENPQYELHAWTEVYIPGAGWLGFDPSNGITTGHTHIAVASSSHHQNTMPVSGSVRGSAVTSLKTNLRIEVLD